MADSRQTVLITGCSEDSVGEELAKEFHRRGFHVIATARSLSRLTRLTSLGVDTRELDLLSTESIRTLCSGVTKLDILFNNAGGNIVMPFADTTPEEFRRMFELNVFPQFELTQILLPHLIHSQGIIVNHTSQSAHALKSPATAYASAKAALATLTDCMRVELEPFDVRVVELVTGGVKSNVTKFETTYTLPEGSIYGPVREVFERHMKGEDARTLVMDGEKYAKRVVSDLLDGWFGTPKWIWRGAFATTMYCVLLANTVWKGCTDGLFRAATGLGGLKRELKKAKQHSS
ncbi:uncharacterized protein PV06_05523 [Exophiala oligosperma]|uniref:Uncharacterized protein n=2 Tax=Chaetothyriales TaxID=34395 RepID=A0A0D2BWR7_9EURO|nr:uncharacterized protein PV06_05523 [Exophiala oligosperma]KAJ9643212.1 hypothetical protein H2204_002108 [Knufia peltigerae]KIW41927.1 hypothetical protein PV06_05523 [Exophiala oligosperma]